MMKGCVRALARDTRVNRYLYLMLLPVMAYFVVFCYGPILGILIAFQDYNVAKGIFGSEFVGLKHFKDFFSSVYAGRTIRNTLLINLYDLLFNFPAPILFALLLNELRCRAFKRTVQTLTYIPYFVSLVVVAGIIIDFTVSEGFINDIVALFGGDRSNLLGDPSYFRAIYVGSNIWQSIGFNSIIYLAALTGISSELYEAAEIDGAGRLRQTLSVTLPGIMPTVVIMLILRIGAMFNVGFEKIILLYSPATYETADVISSYVYRKGVLNYSYSYSTAVELVNSVMNFFLLLAANQLSRRFSETSLW